MNFSVLGLNPVGIHFIHPPSKCLGSPLYFVLLLLFCCFCLGNDLQNSTDNKLAGMIQSEILLPTSTLASLLFLEFLLKIKWYAYQIP